jgi:hypothetical protein
VEDERLTAFVDRTVSPAWLANQYSIANEATLARFLHAMWFLPDGVRKRLEIPALQARIKRVCNGLSPRDRHLRQRLGLLGMASLLGFDCDPSRRPLGPSAVRNALAEMQPREVLTTVHVHLYLGVRTVNAASPRPLRLDPAVAGEHLRLWQEAAPMRPGQQRLNQWMLDWLEAAEADEWRLPKDDAPLSAVIRGLRLRGS